MSGTVSTNPLVGVGANPLKTDAELKQRLAELPDISSKKEFNRWRNCFLTRYEFFLGQEGTGEAEPAYDKVGTKLGKLTKLVDKIHDDLEQERLTIDNCTVSARTRLNECQKNLGLVNEALTALTPATAELEKEAGYTKFQLGALLVRTGFSQYEQLAHVDDVLEEFRTDTLKEIADRQLLELMQQFQVKFATFCDIMADLGLYEAMLKALEMNKLPDEPDSEPEPEPEPEEPESSESSDSSSSSSSDESLQELPVKSPPPSPTKKEKKPAFDPYAFKMSFPAPKPPSGPFIKYVNTGAKTEEEVKKGVHARGKLSSSELNYHHSESMSNNDDEEPFWTGDPDDSEQNAYKPVQKMEFGMDYHGAGNQDWRVSKQKNGNSKKKNGKKGVESN